MAERRARKDNGAPATPGPLRRAIVAAATKIRIDKPDEVRRSLALREDWQDIARGYFDSIGHLKHAAYLIGDSLSKIPLYAAEIPDDAQEVPPPTTDPRAIDALERVKSSMGSHGELIREAAVHLTVTGECYLVGLAARAGDDDEEPKPERWFVTGIASVLKKNGKLGVLDPETGVHIEFRMEAEWGPDGADFWGRIWRRHAFVSHKADSATRGILDHCEELLIVGRYFRSHARARIWQGHILLIPNDYTFGPIDPTKDDPLDDPLNAAIQDATITPTYDEGSASAVAPFVLRYPRTAAKPEHGVDVVRLERTADEFMFKMQESARHGFAQGINLPVEAIFGLGQANHWGAGEIKKSEFDQYLEPTLLIIVEGITQCYYRAALRAAGITDPERFLVWYDPSGLESDTDRSTNAGEAHDRFVITDAAYRRDLGYSDDDEPDDDEVERRIILSLARRGVQPTAVDIQDPPASGPAAASPPAVTASASADFRAQRIATLGRRLTDIDRDLRARVETLLDMTMRRALEQAGARIRTKARSDRAVTAAIANVQPEDVAATLGAAIVAQLGFSEAELVSSAIGSAAPRFRKMVLAAQGRALKLVPGLDDAARHALSNQQADDCDDAWNWLSDTLVALAAERMYDPNPSAPPDGEHSDSSVPFDIVRECVARAGGAHRAGADITSAGIVRGLFERARGFVRTMGTAAGYAIFGALSAQGITVDGYVWEYGTAPRATFQPHMDLDGVEVKVYGGPEWGEFTPGDHAGCRCEATPTLVEVSAIERAEMDEPIAASVEVSDAP